MLCFFDFLQLFYLLEKFSYSALGDALLKWPVRIDLLLISFHSIGLSTASLTVSKDSGMVPFDHLVDQI